MAKRNDLIRVPRRLTGSAGRGFICGRHNKITHPLDKFMGVWYNFEKHEKCDPYRNFSGR